jgi:hypothetical protein
LSLLPTYDYTTTLLEDVFKPRSNPFCPVYVIDFQVCAHFINNFAEEIIQVSENTEDPEKLQREIIKAMWAYRLNRGPDMIPLVPFVGLVVDDLKGPLPSNFSEASVSGYGYWRHIEAHKIDLAEYKGGRKEKDTIFDIIKEEGYKYVRAPRSSFHYVSKEYYEADDLAGLAVRLKREAAKDSPIASRQLVMSTVDCDWSGLVSDAHEVYWANTGPWLPRLRSEKEVCDYYLRKDGLLINKARDCYAVKSQVGDSSDNLAAGTPLRFFDLYDEDSEWGFTKKDTQTIWEILNSETPSNRTDHLESARWFITQFGLCLPEIPPHSPDEKNDYFTKAKKTRTEKSNPDLKGRFKTLCMGKITDADALEKCTKLSIEDEKLRLQVKEQEQEILKCKSDNEDCITQIKAIIKSLKKSRDQLKTIVSTLITDS